MPLRPGTRIMRRIANRATPAVSRFARPALAAVLLLLGGLWAALPASANPVPPGLLMLHIRPYDPGGESPCDDWPIFDCEDLVRSTPLEGPLEFDLFTYDQLNYQNEIYHIDTELQWPPSWTLLGWEACGGAVGTMEPRANGISVDLTWTDCAWWWDDLFLVGRVILDVSGYGQIEGMDGFHFIYGCPQQGDFYDDYGEVRPAEAGLVCGYNDVDCSDYDYCRPTDLPILLSLEVEAGETVQTEFVFSSYHWTGEPCGHLMIDHEAWHVSTVEVIDEFHHRVTVTAIATNLGPGFYEGWVEIMASDGSISRCVPIELTVWPPVSSVPVANPAIDVTTWGGLKSVYR